MRLTAKRIEKWQTQLTKADHIYDTVLQEIILTRQNARGGDLTDLTELLKTLRDCKPGRAEILTNHLTGSLKIRKTKKKATNAKTI